MFDSLVYLGKVGIEVLLSFLCFDFEFVKGDFLEAFCVDFFTNRSDEVLALGDTVLCFESVVFHGFLDRFNSVGVNI